MRTPITDVLHGALTDSILHSLDVSSCSETTAARVAKARQSVRRTHEIGAHNTPSDCRLR